MTTRRSFLKTTTAASAGLLISPSFVKYKSSYIGLQLYTVRDAMQTDPSGTLTKVAQIGYNSVEGATYTGTQKFYGMDAKAFADLLKQNNLIIPSAHYRLGEEKTNGADTKGTLLHEWDKAVDDAAAVGIKHMVCAYLSAAERGGLDHYKQIAETFNKAAICAGARPFCCIFTASARLTSRTSWDSLIIWSKLFIRLFAQNRHFYTFHFGFL